MGKLFIGQDFAMTLQIIERYGVSLPSNIANEMMFELGFTGLEDFGLDVVV